MKLQPNISVIDIPIANTYSVFTYTNMCSSSISLCFTFQSAGILPTVYPKAIEVQVFNMLLAFGAVSQTTMSCKPYHLFKQHIITLRKYLQRNPFSYYFNNDCIFVFRAIIWPLNCKVLQGIGSRIIFCSLFFLIFCA